MGEPSHQPRAALYSGIELVILLALTPLFLLPGQVLSNGWQPALIAVLVVMRIAHLIVVRPRWPSTPLDLSTLIIVACLPMAIWVSVDKELSWTVAGYVALGIAFFFALANWPTSPRTAVAVFELLLAMSAAVIFVGLTVVADAPNLPQLPPFLANLSARTGEIANINILTSVIVFLWPFALAPVLVWRRDRYWWIALVGAAGCLLLAYLIISGQSRAGMLSMGVVLITMLLVRWPRLSYSIVAAPILAAAFLRVVPMADVQAAAMRSLSIGVLSARQEIWTRALTAIDDFSYTGIGIGLFGQVIPALYPYDLLQAVVFPHAHNVYLQVGLDLGMIGLIAYISLWIVSLYMLINLLRKPARPGIRILALGSLGAAVALLFGGLVDAAMWGTKLSFLPWMLFALVVQLSACSEAETDIDDRSPTALT